MKGLRINFETDTPGVRQPFVSAEQVLDHQRLVDPRERVRVQRVHLADLFLELADLGEKTAGQRREREEALLDLDALRREGKEEVGTCVRIDDGLEGRLGFVEREAPASGRSCSCPSRR